MSIISSKSIESASDLQIVVSYTDQDSRLQAEQLAVSLGLELHEFQYLTESTIKSIDFLLIYKNDGLWLKEIASGSQIQVDFNSINKSRLSKKLQLAKAIGLKSGRPSVLDATAGMGRDAYSLAALGCSVTMIEQSKVIAALLKDGLKRQHQSEIAIIEAMSLQEGNAVELIPTLQVHDVIYLDPMFEDRAKQALPKKEMQMFRKLLGHDDKVDELFEVALKHAAKRVVVKRHRTAKPLLDKKPHAELTGKQTRFDIYLT